MCGLSWVRAYWVRCSVSLHVVVYFQATARLTPEKEHIATSPQKVGRFHRKSTVAGMSSTPSDHVTPGRQHNSKKKLFCSPQVGSWMMGVERDARIAKGSALKPALGKLYHNGNSPRV